MMSVDEKVAAALDLVYPRPGAPEDVPVSNVRRGPWRNRYTFTLAAAAAAALILAYPAVTAMSTGHASHPSAAPASPGTAHAQLASFLAGLRPVNVDAARTPHVRSAVLDNHRVTVWAASVQQSGKFVYDLGSARLTDFAAVLPPTDSGLTDRCSWRLQLSSGEARTYQTQPTASVPVQLTGSGTMTITVAPVQPTSGTATCAMTDPVKLPTPPSGGAVSTAAPEPVTSQAMASPPVAPSQQPTQIQEQAAPTAPPPTSPAVSPSGAAPPAASQSSSPAPSATPTTAATPTPTGQPTDQAPQPVTGD
jgi:hypothetical protein